jgi:tetratricopeptide (TPR) repeat protein
MVPKQSPSKDMNLAMTFEATKPVYQETNIFLELGLFHLERLNYLEALTCFNQALIVNPKALEAWAKRCTILQELGCLGEAIVADQNHQKLLSKKDVNVELPPLIHSQAIIAANSDLQSTSSYWHHRANVLHELGLIEEAIESCDRAIKIKPSDCNSWNLRALCLGNLGRHEEALNNFDRALKIKSSCCARINRYVVLCKMGNHEGAITVLEELIKSNPNDGYAQATLGSILGTLDRHEEAIIYLEEAIKLNSDNSNTWRNHGISLNHLLKYESAIKSFSKAIELDSSNGELFAQKGYSFLQLNRYEEAISEYEKSLELDPRESNPWSSHGVCLQNLRRYEEAIVSYKKALEIDSRDANRYFDLGNCLYILGQYEEAIINFKKATEIQCDLFNAWVYQGHCLGNLKLYREALECFDKAIELKPEDKLAWFDRGNVLYDLKQYLDAIDNYNEVLLITNNQFWPAWDNLGLVVLDSQGYKAALAIWNSGIQALLDTESEYHLACGKLHHRRGKYWYQEGRKEINLEWLNARGEYFKALEHLTIDNFPQQHLEILQELLTLRSQLFSSPEIQKLLDDAASKLDRTLQKTDLKEGHKITLQKKFSEFSQLQVYGLAEQDPAHALELAEKHKNRCLKRLLNGWKLPEITHDQIQTILSSSTAIIYWHISPSALTTFILKHGEGPQIWPPKIETDRQTCGSIDGYSGVAEQLKCFESWMQEWRNNYLHHRELDAKASESSEWRLRMNEMLEKLCNILEIDGLIQTHFQDIEKIILIPHRDLHLLPLHSLFTPKKFTISYLPSAQIGLDFEHQESKVGDRILCIQDPTTASNSIDKKNNEPLKWAKREVDSILSFYNNAKTSVIEGAAATKSAIKTALQNLV